MRHAICLFSFTKRITISRHATKIEIYQIPEGNSSRKDTGSGRQLFPNEMPYGPLQDRRSQQYHRRSSCRADTPEGYAMGETIPEEWTGGPEDRIWSRKKTHPTEDGRARCKGCHQEALAECREGLRRGGVVTGKKPCKGTLRNFLSALAQDLDV